MQGWGPSCTAVPVNDLRRARLECWPPTVDSGPIGAGGHCDDSLHESIPVFVSLGVLDEVLVLCDDCVFRRLATFIWAMAGVHDRGLFCELARVKIQLL